MKVSILLTCFNLEKYIGTAIESLISQDFTDEFEIIVVDDCSTDHSRDVINAFTDPRVKKIFLERNMGAAHAINIGFSKAIGKYFCRFDGDDKWYPDYLSSACEILDIHEEVVLVHTDCTLIDSQDNITSVSGNVLRPAHLKPKDNEFQSILTRYYMNAPTIMARKSTWEKFLPWPELFREGLGDWFISCGMTENADSYYINKPLAYYRIHGNNMHRSMIRNGAAERNTFWIFEYFKQRKKDCGLDWNKLYASHYKQLGFSYYQADMIKDARRCLMTGLKNDPSMFKNLQLIRILFATIAGKRLYGSMKRIIGKTT